MEANTITLSDVLNRLMFQKQLRVADLSRNTGVSQPTLQRMVAGTIGNPHRRSLVPIAEYFKVTVDQLKGLESISWLLPLSPEEAGWTSIPLLSWSEVAAVRNFEEIGDEKECEKLLTDAKVSQKAYALRMQDASMEPLFPKGTLLVIDPEKVPRDRSYIVALLNNFPEAIFRQLVIDGPDRYLKPISPDLDLYKMSLMKGNDKILGVLVQARQNFEE